MASHSSKSVITPAASGRTTEIDCGVRPCICLARWPTAQPPERMRVGALFDGDDRGLVEHQAFADHAHQRVGGAQVDGQVRAQQSEESIEHPCSSGV